MCACAAQAQDGSLATRLPGALSPYCAACAESRSPRVMEGCCDAGMLHAAGQPNRSPSLLTLARRSKRTAARLCLALSGLGMQIAGVLLGRW